ncbi:MAG: hypothetical protein WBC18_28430 [Ottowia sp.]|uniref:hypothetical protein n=1 Tax=Ottowia sp. TaxID=1898956 RepID=UPI003C73E9C7
MRIQNVIFPLAILSTVAIAETVVGYHSYYSADARGWWPVGLLVGLYANVGYCVLFSLISGDRALSIPYVVGLNGVLAAIRATASYLYYTLPIDWMAVNMRTAHLTAFQALLHSDLTFYLTPVVFLIAHFIAIRVGGLGNHRRM